MTVGLLDRLMRSSVDRAVRMQPGRTRRIADETLYASPTVRDEVEAITAAGARMVRAGLSPSTLGRIAVRRSPTSATITAEGVDLGAVDNRSLTTVPLDTDLPPVVAVAGGAAAAVWAWPVRLLALGSVPHPEPAHLIAVAGTIAATDRPAGDPGVWITATGVVAVGIDPGDAVTRLEAAETLAAITLERRTHG